MKFGRFFVFIILSGIFMQTSTSRAEVRDICNDWRFTRQDAADAVLPYYVDSAWETVNLPHTAKIEQFATTQGAPQWQGVCWYRKHFFLKPEDTGKKIFLKIEAAMNVAEIWVNGTPRMTHLGGFLPVVLDITHNVSVNGENVISIRLDNYDNKITGPKPLEILDFNMYHGLYRKAWLIVKNPLHITDPIWADKPASGGLFVTYPEVSKERAVVRIQTHIQNDDTQIRTFRVVNRLIDAQGEVVQTMISKDRVLDAGKDMDVTLNLEVDQPALWSPLTPNLYTVKSTIVGDDKESDEVSERIGIRHIKITKDGFWINGEKMFLRGVNRHQEYPYIGYALSDEAHFRDAKIIKEAGFDYVRLSHYPHSPAFMDACDELGLVVMDCLPGWQYMGGPEFQELQYRNSRELIRRDRNHPCVILWEVSLNETGMSQEFIQKTNAIGHEEYPGDQCYTCGWVYGYDVFIQARQHGGCTKETGHPCLVSEYGDWEYYAQNAGLSQDAWNDLQPDDRNSRMLRWHGEKALLQQCTNFQEAHNDNRKTTAFADGLWVMFDYNRGYAPDIESSGCVDITRIPKFSYYFFRSQRNATETYDNAATGPMVFIANYWMENSMRKVRVFSNCDEVELRLNGQVIARQKPDTDKYSTHLNHSPFSFDVPQFQPGKIEAVAFLNGKEAARQMVQTPGIVEKMDLEIALRGRAFCQTGKDVVFAYAALKDKNETVNHDAWENVWFAATGEIELVGMNPFTSEAGISSILVQGQQQGAKGAVYAMAIVNDESQSRILTVSTGLNGAEVSSVKVYYTTDGSEPTLESPVYSGPIPKTGSMQAILVAEGKILLKANSAAEKYSVPGSVREGAVMKQKGATGREVFPVGPSKSPVE